MTVTADIEMEQSPVLHMKVLDRAQELPVIKSAATYVTTFYQQAKSYSPLVNSTLNIAENGAYLAGRMATPVIRRLDGNIQKMDDAACLALLALENKYPVISKETDEVSASLLSATAVYRESAVKQASTLLESTPGQVALMGLAGYLRVANKVADITLPSDDGESSMSFESTNVALMNVATLSDKLYRRIKRQSLLQLQQLQEVSTAALNGLQSQLTMLELAKVHLAQYGGHASDETMRLWQELQVRSSVVQQQTLQVAGQIQQQLQAMYDTAAASAVTQRTLQLAQQISAQLLQVYNSAAEQAATLPAALQTALLASKVYAENLYKQLSEVKSTEDLSTLALSQIRESLNLFQSSASYLFQAAQNFPLLKNVLNRVIKSKPIQNGHVHKMGEDISETHNIQNGAIHEIQDVAATKDRFKTNFESPLNSLSADISRAREQIAKSLAPGAMEAYQSYMKPERELKDM